MPSGQHAPSPKNKKQPLELNGGSISGVGGFGLQLWDWRFGICVSPWLLGGEGFGAVKFWDDGFEKLIEESPNSQLGMQFFTSMSDGNWGVFF